MNNELKNLENNNNIFNDNLFNNLDQTNKYQQLGCFKNITKKQNKSIISKLFYILLEITTKCQMCNIGKYNYQVSFFFEFPLESVYKYCMSSNIPTKKNNNRICIPLFACFELFRQNTFFTGENKIYCDICKSQNEALYVTNIYSLPPTIILILNRGKGNIFDCEVDFPQHLNLHNFVQNYSNFNYKLRGVITHLGPSGTSGHFIAYCRHRITEKWYCYNDSVVSLCEDQENDFRKCTPYILFYESINGRNNFIFDEDYGNNNNNQNIFGINFMNNMKNVNNILSSNNMNNIFPMNNIHNINNMNSLNNINIMSNLNYLNNMINLNKMNNINNMSNMNNNNMNN